MSESGTQYTLRLGLDTGLAPADVWKLDRALTHLGQTADKVASASERAAKTTAAEIAKLDQSMTRLGKSTDRITASSDRAARTTARMTTATAKSTRATADATRTTNRFAASQRTADTALTRTTKRLLGYAAAYFTVQQAARLAAGAVGNFSDIESGLVGIRKTTDLAKDELAELYEEVLALATGPVPIATKELLGLAEVSGQLGVRGKENLLAYVETLGQLSAATDIVGAEGAANMARLLNVSGELPEQVRATGAALTALGNDAAATESEILDVATEVGLATAQFQIGSVNALALATAMKEMGIEAEIGGTAVGRTLREIQKAIATGGEDLQAFADAAGVSAEEFTAAFGRDKVEAFLLLFEGLSRYGEDASIVLDELGLGSDRLSKVLPILATDYQNLESRVRQGTDAAREGVALTTEAGRAFDQTKSDLDRLANAYRGVSAEVGRGLSPALREVTVEFKEFLLTSREAALETGENLGEALKVVSAILLTLLENLDHLIILFQVWLGLKIILWMNDLAITAARVVAEYQAYAVVASQAAAAEAAMATASAHSAIAIGDTGTVVDLYRDSLAKQGDELIRTGTVLDLYDDRLYKTADATTKVGDAAAGSQKKTRRFLDAGITPLSIGLLAAIPLLLETNRLIKEWGDRYAEATAKMVAQTQRWKDITNEVARDTRRLLDDTGASQRALAAEFEKEGLSPDLIDSNDERAQVIVERFERQTQRERVDLRERIEKLMRQAQREANETSIRYNDAKAAIEKLEPQVQAIEGYQDLSRRIAENLPLSAAQSLGTNVQPPSDADAQLLKRYDELKKEIAESLGAAQRAGEGYRMLEEDWRRLDAAIGEFVKTQGAANDTAEDGRQPLGDLADEAKEAAVSYALLTADLDKQLAATLSLAHAYGEGEDAVRARSDALEIESRLLSSGIDLTTEQARALGWEATLRKKLADQVAAERRLTGEQLIADLDRQIQAQSAINAAYVDGTEAVVTAREEQAVAADQAEATAQAHEGQVDTIEELIAVLFDLIKAEAALAAEQNLRQQVDDLGRLSDAYDDGIASVQSMEAALAAENAIRQETADYMGEERDRILELAVAREQLFARVQAKDIVEQLKDQLKATQEIAKVRRSDFFTERQYQTALRLVNVERELEIQLNGIRAAQAAEIAAIRANETLGVYEQAFAIAKVNDEYADLVTEAKKAARETAKIEIDADANTDQVKFDQWVSAAQTIAEALREVDDELGVLADSALDVLVAFEDISTEAGKIDFAVAAGNLGQALTEQLSGPNNYAAEGALVGAIVGFIIGVIAQDYSGQVGASVGAAAGGALGGLIKKGADEFLAEFELSAEGGLEGTATKVEGKMGSVGRRYIDAIERGIEEALDQLGVFLVGVPDISIKVREGVFGVVVGAVKGHFESMEEAVDFAILEVLKQGDLIGLSDEVRTALQNSTAETFQALSEDLDFAKWLERLPEIGDLASQAGTALFDAVDQFAAALRKADELGLPAAKIEQWFAHTLEAIRNNVLGIVETEEERIRREAEGFNLARQLIEAEQHMRRADLILKRQELQAEAEILAAKEGLTVAELQAEAAKLDASARFAAAHLEIAKATAEAAAAIFSALSAVELALSTVDSILAGLPDLISEEEIQEAINRARGGGGARRQEREDARREIDDLRLLASGMGEAALDLRRELEDFEDWIAAARKLGIAEGELAQARLDNLQLLEEELLSGARDAVAAPDPAGLTDLLDRYVESLESAAELAAARAAAAGTSVGEEMARLAEELVAGFAAELQDAIRGTLPGLIASGDLGGLLDLRESLLELASSLPRELASELGQIAEALGLIDHAIATMEALGLSGPIAGVNASPIQDYLDMAMGISEVDRELRDVQLAFLAVLTEARLAGASEEELALIHEAYGEALQSLTDSVLDSVREYLDAAAGIGEFERELIDLQKTFADARAGLTALQQGAEDEGTLFDEPSRPNVVGTKGPDAGDRQPRRPDEEFEGATEGAEDLANALDDLEAAERRAIRALGVEFVQSLEDLGVALPVELTMELARAQFELARAEAISSALALAAAGAFDGMSISIGELLNLITQASFEDSAFDPTKRDSSAGRGSSEGGQDDTDNLARRVEEQLRAWDRLSFGDATQEAIDFAETLVQIEADATAAGISLDRVSESYQRAVGAFVDDALAEFEDLDLSPLEAELQSLTDRFVDLLVAFDVAGASAEDLLRLEQAFTTAMEDFLERATAGIRAYAEELRANDPRRSSEQRFVESQAEFQDLLARAQGGDLEAIEELESAARSYREEALAFLGFGVGSQEVLDLILAGLDSIGDVEIVPEDIALLREQAERLLALIQIAEAQPTRDSTDTGFRNVQEAIDDDRSTSEDLLDLILQAIADGELEVAGIGDVLQTLAEMVGLVDLSTDDLQRILDTVSGTVDVADSLSPQQLDSLVNLVASLGEVENLTEDQQTQLADMVAKLLGLNTLSQAQRDLLLGIDSEAEDQGETLNDISTKIAETTQKVAQNTAFTEPLLRSINVRAGEQRVLLAEVRDLLAAMPSFHGGGLMPDDGLAYLHAGERVLSPRQTDLLGELSRDLVPRTDRLTAPRPEPRLSPPPPSGALRAGGEGFFDGSVLRRSMVELRTAIEQGNRDRNTGTGTVAELALRRLQQGGSELEVLESMAAEIAALRRRAEQGTHKMAGR